MISRLHVKVMALFLLALLLPLGVGFFSLHTADSAIIRMVLNQLENVANDNPVEVDR